MLLILLIFLNFIHDDNKNIHDQITMQVKYSKFIIETEESCYKINHKCLLYILKFHGPFLTS